jgi:membrane-bound lytic murein transglycosylase D
MFGGDWHLALASYNSGPGRVQRAIKQVGKTDFWSISAKSKALPRETREYVPMILAAIVIARNPAQYGFSIESSDPRPSFETVAVSHPVDLRKVAEWAGTTLATIHELNPELRRQTTPKDSAYELKVPAGTSAEIALHLNESVDVALPSETYYTVKRGDTLPIIARRLQVTRSDLVEANHIGANARLIAGQQLLIPDGLLPAARSSRPAVTPIVASSSAARVKSEYRVRQGDTLTSIAELYSTSVKTLQSWNPQLTSSRVTVGQRLTVYK